MLDTTPEAAEIQAAIWRRLSGDAKVRIAADMSMAVRKIALARIAEQHPDFTADQRRDQLVWELYGIRLPR